MGKMKELSELNNNNLDSETSEHDIQFESWLGENESELYEIWDLYKYEQLLEHFHYDDVDFLDDDLFNEMSYSIFIGHGIGLDYQLKEKPLEQILR